MFAYCLIVLRSVRAEDTDGTDGFVPALSVTSAIVLALASLALLLLFIHHMGQLIQVSNIAARIARGTLRAVDRLYPETFVAEPTETPARKLSEWQTGGDPDRLSVARPGFVRRIDSERIERALPDGVRVHVAVRPGDFVTDGDAALEVWPAGRLSDGQRDALPGAIVVESERDLEQDAGFGIRQLADIALHALSPGVNDPTTAVTCVGYLRAVLERLAAREGPPEVRALAHDVEIVAPQAGFADLLHEAFGELSPYAAAGPRVTHVTLDTLASVASAARAAGAGDRADAVQPLAHELAARAREHTVSDRERLALEAALARV
jgi:uncharacterized membrane protein